MIARADSVRSNRPDGAGPNPGRWNLFKREAAGGTLQDYRYLSERDRGLALVRATLDAIVYPISPRRPALLTAPPGETGGVGAATNYANLNGFPDLSVTGWIHRR